MERPQPRRVRPWSVRAHLTAVIAATLVVFVAIGATSVLHDYSRARRIAVEDTTYQASIAAKAIQARMAGRTPSAIPPSIIATTLARELGGRLHYSFTVVDTRANTILSSSTLPQAAGTSVAGTPFDSIRNGEEATGLNGIRRIFASADIPQLSWRVYAGLATSEAFAEARATLWREVGTGLAAIVVMGLLVFVINRRIAQPLRSLTEAIKRTARAVTPEPLQVGGPAEVAQLVDEFNEMVQLRSKYEESIAHKTFYDGLTGLPNRVLFMDRLRKAIARTRRVPQGIAVLFVDVDRFKLLNASVGHAAGDRVLVEIGERLVHVVRPEDTIARFGGDEFVLLCEGLVSTEQAEVIAQRISNCLADPFRIGEIEVTLTVSVGIAMNRDGLTAEDIIRDADAAMTRAKETGKARYEFSDDRMHARANDRLEIESDLRRALERNEFTLHYQPIVDLQHGQIVAAEALLRWNHPTKGEQQPGEFVPVAEETGLINSIGRWVLMQACRQAAEWTAQGHPLSVSVNLSARQLARPGLEAIVANALNDAQLDPSRLCLEITESTLMDEGAPVYEVLRQLKGLGVSLSVDDFGTGYSSLAYLQRFPMDQLKIDRAFVEDLGLGSARSALVGAIVQMGRALEIEVVAEGVENVAQLGDLQRLGCLRAQGFVFAYPMPAEALTQILDEPILPQSPKRTVKMGVVRRAEQPARGASKTQAL